ncbi:MAG: GC-type dockerin domain-anchored protein [Phycisphaerales bacterium JB060]
MKPRAITIVAVLFMFMPSAHAQCHIERLGPEPTGRHFGGAIGMTDEHLIVGDDSDSRLCGNPFCANGIAYAYRRDAEGRWVFDHEIAPAGLAPSMTFGARIAIDGDRALIGAQAAFVGPGLGVAYVFAFDGTRWIETGYLAPPDDRRLFGGRVALRGDLAMAGSPLERVVVYHEGDEEWEIVHDLESPDSPDERSDFGWSFDISDDWVVVGAPLERVVAPNGGAVYVYRRLAEGRLELAQKLVAPDVLGGPRFGSAVDIESDTLVVGGPNSDRAFESQGAVYVFHLEDGQWILRQTLTHDDAGRNDGLGITLTLDSGRLVAGVVRQLGGGAYLFQRGVDGTWREVAELHPEQDARSFGASPAIAAGMVAVGAPDTMVGGEVRGSVDLFDLACLLCPPDLDADGALTVFDYLTFLNLFDDGDARADFDGDGELTLFDFLAFQTAFDAGCA